MTDPHFGEIDPTPLLTQLLTEAQRSTAPFHTPGHKGRSLWSPLLRAWGDSVFAADLPELPGLDNLFAPEGVIQSAQALAAETFGADRTWFSVNGSTAGVIAGILATCGPGDRILLPRTVHRSAISGLILSGAVPVFLTPEREAVSGLVGSITPSTLATALEQYPDIKAVLLVSPTYEGICADLAAIAPLCHARQIPLLVDEAHGPHFGFHPDLPPSALSQGADLSIQSTHKVLSGLTQAAMVHLRGSLVDGDRLSQALQLIQSTSPSYLLLASLDATRAQMAQQGTDLLSQTLALAKTTRDRLHAIPGLRVFELPQPQPGFAALDPTRITLDVSGLGLTGFDVDDRFNQTHGVIAELPSLRHLTFLLSLGTTAADCDRLIQASQALRCQSELCQSELYRSDSPQPQTAPPLAAFPLPVAPPLALSPRQAFFQPAMPLPFEATLGHMSAETVCPYPPGIPVLLPGERITAAAIAYLQQIKASGGWMSGCSDPSLATLNVIALATESPASRHNALD